jgi:hypothetical protein
MSASKRKPSKDRQTPGPKPEVLKVEGNWQKAIKKSLAKKKPKEGWPD